MKAVFPKPKLRTKAQAARTYGVSGKIVARWVARFKAAGRAGLSRLKDIDPAKPLRRYERDYPAEMIHIDIKKLRRFSLVGHRIIGDPQQGKSCGAGREFVHVCVDDASRVAFSQILPDEPKESAVAFLAAAVASYASALPSPES